MMNYLNLIVTLFLSISIGKVPLTAGSYPAMNRSDLSLNQDSLEITESIKAFLNWYKANYKKSSKFRLVGIDKHGNYFVDLKVCEKYLKHLRSSGYISEHYVAYWRGYFESRSRYFKEHPQNEGPPEGFDYDLVIGTQEPDLMYNAADQLTFRLKEIGNATATVEVFGEWNYDFKMSRSRGVWKIDLMDIHFD